MADAGAMVVGSIPESSQNAKMIRVTNSFVTKDWWSEYHRMMAKDISDQKLEEMWDEYLMDPKRVTFTGDDGLFYVRFEITQEKISMGPSAMRGGCK